MGQFRKVCTLFALLIAAAPGQAQDSSRSRALDDPLLDKLTGDWNVERTFGNGRTAKNVVHAEWVLQHQFLELHYRDTAAPPKYEAIILIGYDNTAKHYICHWSDIFGGDYSTDGFAERDIPSNKMEFKFEFHDGPLTNRFTFDPQSGMWTSTIHQAEKGEWKLFCEDKFARPGRDTSKP
jgi:hypothetical protein